MTMEDCSDDALPAVRSYDTAAGVTVRVGATKRPYAGAVEPLIDALDARRGVLLASSFEYPGRYTRWDVGFVDPPLEIVGRGRDFLIRAVNARGEILLPPIVAALQGTEAVESVEAEPGQVRGRVRPPDAAFTEEARSRQPSLFSMLRAVIGVFAAPDDAHLGLYGAFGYDLAFQFEPIEQRLARDPEQRDLALFLPDEILVVDHRRERAMVYSYDFSIGGRTTEGMSREGTRAPYRPGAAPAAEGDHVAGEFADIVRLAHERFRRGDLFEVVPGQTFFAPSPAPPSEVFRRLRRRNPSPYGALMNLWQGEHLVAASPEMYVRVEGRRIETCPISGTIRRGRDAIEDADQILTLLSSEKETAELTMCTDVDRNDKSRVCEPGSVRVIGRRQIEMYSRLIHTVDHVEGTLRDGFDALDGFLAHAWAVTVTGAPKRWAMQFIEDHEKSPRLWYGGAIGLVGFNGDMNTGLTLRTVRIKDGIAAVRAGATLLFDSEPEAEEAECRLKASALLDAIGRPDAPVLDPAGSAPRPGTGRRVLIVDHEDSFVHTLAGYVRETGAEVTTLRSPLAVAALDADPPDLVLLSPGPGRPMDFHVSQTVSAALAKGVPVFGVCLGLQGIVEHCGGTLSVLDKPVHGKPSRIRVLGGILFEGLPPTFTAGRYHSLYATRMHLPDELQITAETEDGLVMGVEHVALPVAAVQFHPESILTLDEETGRRLIANAITRLAS